MDEDFEDVGFDEEPEETMGDLWEEYGPEDENDENWSTSDRYDD